jgi:hypothetical protein
VTKIAVALMTCERYDYTKRTVESFVHHNPDRSRFILLHGDDGSRDHRVRRLPPVYGFRTVAQERYRQGWLPMRRLLIRRAARLAPWILLLENDLESVRPFPWDMFDWVAAHEAVQCLRLFGLYKGPRNTYPCLTLQKGDKHDRKPARWTPVLDAPEPCQRGLIHWSALATVGRADLLVTLNHGFKQLANRPVDTVRVLDNVFLHIGVKQTPKMLRERPHRRVVC